MFNSESISGAMVLQRRNNFIPDQITKPVQEKDLDVLEDFSSPEHLLQVCFTRRTTAVGLRTAMHLHCIPDRFLLTRRSSLLGEATESGECLSAAT